VALELGESYDTFESLTVSTSAVPLTAATYARAEVAFITNESNPCRFRLDGTNPTASVGHILPTDAELILDSRDQISRARFIRSGASDATLRVSYGQV